MRVLVAGAGISGLTAAHALTRAGHTVTVLEQAPALRLGGGAITLWHNGTAILTDLGIDLTATGQPLTTLALRTATGRTILRIDLDALARRFDSHALALPRRALITRLHHALPTGTVTFDAPITRLRTGPDAVHVHTRDGHHHTADLLIGADGVHSRVRAALLGDTRPALTGAATWQGLAPAPFDPGTTTTMMIGRQGDLGYTGAGGGLIQCFFDIPWPRHTPPQPLPRDEALRLLSRRYATWGDPAPQLLDTLTRADAGLYPHTRHTVPRRWGAGRCVLLGDAAHGMPPIMAHGANQALEDVAALMDCLTTPHPPDPSAIARAYTARRRRRAALASTLATRSLAVSGPRTLLQSEHLLRLNATLPPRLATLGFGRLLAALSNRI
ncbi:NAD(P)/FAD-dependent oxidoreductase [Actinomadura sp. NEAU-AAG7]|uniref:FAD-dependent oxidoreductase n=1 Tax=Actinomadura sp. NEAU-AAG7 TaxID=2839640 RepID=UPI001BE44E9B|nr:NAD(P)/FAD-dependent oxidoreductase [Actinomadura sp. NEAU-AAG7]MBT2211939.1 FAD-dependent monooxygenase [Actinomadura sp. NEAU-AAG7]